MKNIILFQSVRRSPPAPLKKGGKYRKITINKRDLGRSQIVATFNKPLSLGGLILLATLFTNPANAHKIEIQQDVGATIHIEPNDAPRAGESALTWFAITQKGGKIIPLNQCDCKLSVYSQTSPEGTPLQQPILKAVSQESYQGIPAATITFPAAGAYQLQLQGNPKNGVKFSPFELKFDINVAPGVVAPNPNIAVIPQQEQTTPPWLIPAAAIGVIFTGAIAFLVWQKKSL
jgi:hypothetical protein